MSLILLGLVLFSVFGIFMLTTQGFANSIDTPSDVNEMSGLQVSDLTTKTLLGLNMGTSDEINSVTLTFDSEIPDIERIVMETITSWRFTPPKNASGQACTTIANLPIKLECEDIEKRTWEISEIDQVPKVLKVHPPKYPLDLKVKNIQGRVVLRIIIDETGMPEEIGIESLTHKGFAEAAIAAVKNYEFTPGYYQGKPVKVTVKLPIYFSLN